MCKLSSTGRLSSCTRFLWIDRHRCPRRPCPADRHAILGPVLVQGKGREREWYFRRSIEHGECNHNLPVELGSVRLQCRERTAAGSNPTNLLAQTIPVFSVRSWVCCEQGDAFDPCRGIAPAFSPMASVAGRNEIGAGLRCQRPRRQSFADEGLCPRTG